MTYRPSNALWHVLISSQSVNLISSITFTHCQQKIPSVQRNKTAQINNDRFCSATDIPCRCEGKARILKLGRADHWAGSSVKVVQQVVDVGGYGKF